MKNFLSAVMAGGMAAAIAAPASADTYTWQINSTFYSFYASTEADAGGAFKEKSFDSLPGAPDGGTVSGWIQFDSTTQMPIAFRFTTTASTVSSPQTATVSGTPVTYTLFTGATYDSSIGSDIGSDYYQDGSSDVYLSDINTFYYVDPYLDPSLWTGTYNINDVLTPDYSVASFEENLLSCSDPYIQATQSCLYFGSKRVDTRFVDSEGQLLPTSVTTFTYLGATPPQQTTDTPEPATLALLGSGLVALGVGRRFRRRV